MIPAAASWLPTVLEDLKADWQEYPLQIEICDLKSRL
jgi:hypothetical protein